MLPNEMLPLELLNAGDWADVMDVAGDPNWINRMAELGLRIGSRLQVIRCGSPCLLRVDDTRLSLRGDMTMQIFVRRLNGLP